MLKFLHSMHPDAKRKLAAILAGLITLCIFAVWLLHSMGTLSRIADTTAKQSGEIYSFLDQNVEIAYNAFHARLDPLFSNSEATSTATTTDITATSTATTTIQTNG
jgi:hypothetical protein